MPLNKTSWQKYVALTVMTAGEFKADNLVITFAWRSVPYILLCIRMGGTKDANPPRLIFKIE